jgi:chromate transporter
MLASGSATAQIVVLLLGGIAGFWLCRSAVPASQAAMAGPVSRRAGKLSLLLFSVLLLGLPLFRGFGSWHQAALFDAFYRAGALVFGGGHVVLPLLHDAFVAPGEVTDDIFLAGYGAAQAIPGPLFAFAAYLGAVAAPAPHRLAGALLGLTGIFLPGMLILMGTLPFWDKLRVRADAQAVMRGVNASVVGLLGAALYNPVWTSSVKSAADAGVALAGFALLSVWRAPPLLIVTMGAASGMMLTHA